MRYMIAEGSWSMVGLSVALKEKGILLTRCEQPEDLLLYLETCQTDLLVLDADNLQHESFTLKDLRLRFPELAIAVMQQTPEPEFIVRALDHGADAVLDHCAPLEEMSARLQALARRRHGLAHSNLVFGPFEIDIDLRIVSIHGETIKLTPKLYELMEYLALRPRQLVSRSALLGHVYGLNDEPNTRVFDVYMCNLRSMLKATDGEVEIETVRGAGFRLHVPDVPEDEVAA